MKIRPLVWLRYLPALCLFALLGCKNVDLQQVAGVINDYQQPLDQQTVVAGLKQALEVGTKNAVSQSAATNGFYQNARLKIGLPAELTRTASTLRKVGLGQLVDQFELQMNRSAEKAAGMATKVFVQSISQMSISDAWGILRGPDNAATDYFRRTTESQLRQKFQPVISESMSQVGFYPDYKRMLSTYEAIPFAEKPSLDIENHIMQKSLDGLFLLIADEEKQIRNNPAARVTDLLKRVFSD